MPREQAALQVFTWAGMSILGSVGFFTPKELPAIKLVPLAFGFVGYVVISNVSLEINSVGFYQVRAQRGAGAPSFQTLCGPLLNLRPAAGLFLSLSPSRRARRS